MYKKFSVLIIFAVICLSLFSCGNSSDKNALEENETEVEKEEVWSSLEKVSDIYGKWVSADGFVIKVPMYYDGLEYFLFSGPERDDTDLWNDYAAEHHLSIEEMWQKRFSMIYYVYGVFLPLSDENHSQYGLKLSLRGGRIYSRNEWLIPVFIVMKNTGYIQISDRGNLKEQGYFNFYESEDLHVFDNLESEQTIYSRE